MTTPKRLSALALSQIRLIAENATQNGYAMRHLIEHIDALEAELAAITKERDELDKAARIAIKTMDAARAEIERLAKLIP